MKYIGMVMSKKTERKMLAGGEAENLKAMFDAQGKKEEIYTNGKLNRHIGQPEDFEDTVFMKLTKLLEKDGKVMLIQEIFNVQILLLDGFQNSQDAFDSLPYKENSFMRCIVLHDSEEQLKSMRKIFFSEKRKKLNEWRKAA